MKITLIVGQPIKGSVDRRAKSRLITSDINDVQLRNAKSLDVVISCWLVRSNGHRRASSLPTIVCGHAYGIILGWLCDLLEDIL